MKKTTIAIATLVVAGLIAGSVSDSTASRRLSRSELKSPKIDHSQAKAGKSEVRQFAGKYSGLLTRSVLIGGTRISITKKTVLVSARHGLLDPRVHVTNHSVLVSAVKDGDKWRATMVVVQDNPARVIGDGKSSIVDPDVSE